MNTLPAERLHRVDASRLPSGTGVSVGGCCTTECAHAQASAAQAADDGFDVPESERDPVLLRRVLLAYAGTLAFCAWALWRWLGS